MTWQWVAFSEDNVGNPQFADVCEVDERCFLSSNPDHLRRLHHKFPLLSSHHVWVLFSHDVKDSVQELTDSSMVKTQPSSQWKKTLKKNKYFMKTGIQCKCTTPSPLHKTMFLSCGKKPVQLSDTYLVLNWRKAIISFALQSLIFHSTMCLCMQKRVLLHHKCSPFQNQPMLVQWRNWRRFHHCFCLPHLREL